MGICRCFSARFRGNDDEIKKSDKHVEALREGIEDAGSTPATSTSFNRLKSTTYDFGLFGVRIGTLRGLNEEGYRTYDPGADCRVEEPGDRGVAQFFMDL